MSNREEREIGSLSILVSNLLACKVVRAFSFCLFSFPVSVAHTLDLIFHAVSGAALTLTFPAFEE